MAENKECEQAVRQAEEDLADLQESGKEAVGGDALALLNSLLTHDEIIESDLRVSLSVIK